MKYVAHLLRQRWCNQLLHTPAGLLHLTPVFCHSANHLIRDLGVGAVKFPDGKMKKRKIFAEAWLLTVSCARKVTEFCVSCSWGSFQKSELRACTVMEKILVEGVFCAMACVWTRTHSSSVVQRAKASALALGVTRTPTITSGVCPTVMLLLTWQKKSLVT